MRSIDFNDPPTQDNWAIPKEVWEYYQLHDYSSQKQYGPLGRPLDIELAKEIFEALKGKTKYECNSNSVVYEKRIPKAKEPERR